MATNESVTIPKSRRTSKINTWKPKKGQEYVVNDGKLFICYFEKVFPDDRAALYDRFMIKKGSYENQLDIITRYTNFFMNCYDFDNELITAYFKLKYALDKEKMYNTENMDAFIELIYEILFTPTLVKKICDMVYENYLDDIEAATDEKKLYQKNEKKHLESLEFTNIHMKILHRISFSMKIMSPVMFHYLALNVIKIDKDSDIIYKFYKKLFEIFGTAENYQYFSPDGELLKDKIETSEIDDSGEYIKRDIDYDDFKDTIVRVDEENPYNPKYYDEKGNYYMLEVINVYNKLFVYVKAKVLESNSTNSPIFEQREILGVDIYSVIKSFTKKVLISENIVKYKFNEHYDEKQHKYKENIVGFNKTIIKFQLNYFLKEQYSKNLTEITNSKSSDGLSGVDKMEMNLSKIDEGVTTIADLNIDMTINRLRKIIDVPLNEEEIEYYRVNMHPTKLQTQLIKAYYSKYFGSCRDLELLTRRDYVILALLLKKKLLIELGYETDDDGEMYSAALPYFITGNVADKVCTRIIRNNRFNQKVEESEVYQKLISQKYNLLESVKQKYLLHLLSSIINTRFTYCIYEHPEMLGEEIKYNEDKIADELLFFLNTI